MEFHSGSPVSSANYFTTKKEAKKKQYEVIIEWLNLLGYPKVELHLLPVTYEGFIPTETKTALSNLGVRPIAWKELKVSLERHLRASITSIKWQRRKLECSQQYKNRSGYYWVKKLLRKRTPTPPNG